MAVLSLQHYPFDGTDSARDELVTTALRKAERTFSRHARKPVSDSHEESTMEMPLGPSGKVSFGFVAPPQINDKRAFALAFMEATAFFYLLTYDSSRRVGHLWQGSGFFPVDLAARSDWGNPVQRWFMTAVSTWPWRLLSVAANSFFKVAIRRCHEDSLWSCALEWNEGVRIVSFFGEESAARSVAADMPGLFPGSEEPLIRLPNRITRFRFEIPSKSEDDGLFSPEHTVNSWR